MGSVRIATVRLLCLEVYASSQTTKLKALAVGLTRDAYLSLQLVYCILRVVIVKDANWTP